MGYYERTRYIYVQYPLAYMRMKHTNWISIDEVTNSTSNLLLHEQNNPNGNQAYILKSPLNPYELFVIEFRATGDPYSKDNFIDAKIPEQGVIVYRIDTTVQDVGNITGKIGVEILSGDGNAKTAALTVGDSFGNSDVTSINNALKFSDGTNSGIFISNLRAGTDGEYDTMTLDFSIPEAGSFDLWENTNYPSNTNTITSIVFNDNLYTATRTWSSIDFSMYNGTEWTSLPSYLDRNDSSPNNRLFEYNGKLHYSFTHDYNDVKIIVFDGTSWSELQTVADAAITDNFDVAVYNNDIYVAYIKDDYKQVLLKNATKTSSLVTIAQTDVFSVFLGQPKLLVNNDELYTFYRAESSNIYAKKTNNGTTITDVLNPNLSENNYAIESYNGKIYLLIGGETATMKVFDGTSWQNSATLNKSSFEPSIAVAQGNLYMANMENGSYEIEVYRYSTETGEAAWTKEGEIVDRNGHSSSKSKITAIGDSLYISYITSLDSADGKAVVRKKETANELLSITITPPTKDTYVVGETVSEAGITVTANYTSFSKLLEKGEYIIKHYETTIAGFEKQATISFEGINRNFQYTVTNPILEKYTITATNGANGTISPSGEIVVNEGEDKEFTFTADTGYEIDQVTVNDTPVSVTGTSYTITNVSTDTTINVTFKAIPKPSYTITATNGANGTISPSGEIEVNEGEDKEFTFTADTGYEIDQVTINDTPVSVTSTSYTITNVSADTTINVVFKKIIEPSLPTVEGDNQRITVNSEQNVIFKIDANFGDFIRVEYNGSRLDTANYSVANGSIILTLKSDYVKTLNVGTHIFTAVVGSNRVPIKLIIDPAPIVKPSPDTDIPPTSDDNNMILYLILAVISLIGLGVIIYIKKR